MKFNDKKITKARSSLTYRGARRNLRFGRKPVGNTKPWERQLIFVRGMK